MWNRVRPQIGVYGIIILYLAVLFVHVPSGAFSNELLKNAAIASGGGMVLVVIGFFLAIRRAPLPMPTHPLFPLSLLLVGIYAVPLLLGYTQLSFNLLDADSPAVWIAAMLAGIGAALFIRQERAPYHFYGAFFLSAAIVCALETWSVFIRPYFSNSSISLAGEGGGVIGFFGLVFVGSYVMLLQQALPRKLQLLIVLLFIWSAGLIALSSHTVLVLALATVFTLLLTTSVSSAHLHTRTPIPRTVGAALIGGCLLLLTLWILALTTTIEPRIQSAPAHPGFIGSVAVWSAFMTESDLSTKLFGAGAGSFQAWWAYAKPLVLNGTNVALADFSKTPSLLLATAFSAGFLGFASLVIFLGAFLMHELSVLIDWRTGLRPLHAAVGIYTGLWIAVGETSPVIYLLFWLCVGMVMGLSTTRPPVADVQPRIFARAARALVGIGLIVLGGYLVFSAGMLALTRANYEIGIAHFESSSDIDIATNFFNTATWYRPYPLAFRALSQMRQYEAELVLLHDTSGQAPERAFTLLDTAVYTARRATELDPREYGHFMVLGNAYTQLSLLGIEGSFQSAEQHFLRAQTLSPFNPVPRFLRARLYHLAGRSEEASLILDEALLLLPSYEPALTLKAEMEQEEALTD